MRCACIQNEVNGYLDTGENVDEFNIDSEGLSFILDNIQSQSFEKCLLFFAITPFQCAKKILGKKTSIRLELYRVIQEGCGTRINSLIVQVLI